MTPADREWAAYNREVWPGINQAEGEGLAGRLLEPHPVTREGLSAKAATIWTMGETAHYTGDCRDDACRLCEAVVRDPAG